MKKAKLSRIIETLLLSAAKLAIPTLSQNMSFIIITNVAISVKPAGEEWLLCMFSILKVELVAAQHPDLKYC